jgi:hypothetical protein
MSHTSKTHDISIFMALNGKIFLKRICDQVEAFPNSELSQPASVPWSQEGFLRTEASRVELNAEG